MHTASYDIAVYGKWPFSLIVSSTMLKSIPDQACIVLPCIDPRILLSRGDEDHHPRPNWRRIELKGLSSARTKCYVVAEHVGVAIIRSYDSPSCIGKPISILRLSALKASKSTNEISRILKQTLSIGGMPLLRRTAANFRCAQSTLFRKYLGRPSTSGDREPSI